MGEKKRRLAAAGGKGGHRAAMEHAARARELLRQSAFGPALGEIVAALEAAPERDELWMHFGELVRFFSFRHPTDPRLHAALARAVEHPAVDPGDLVRPVSSLALSRPQAEVLADPLLLRLMQDVVMRDPRIEDLVAGTRRKALLDGEALPLERLVAIAHQCFNSEYLPDETPAETAALVALKARIEGAADLPGCALYSAYRPLDTLASAADLAQALALTPLASLARCQITEPAAEERLRASIASFGASSTSVSSAVRAQYEANPYPRWLRTQTRFVAAPVREIARELFPSASIAPGGADLDRILVAGCGTGQNAIATALRFARCSVLAIDLSLASLAYAKRKTVELGIGNIDYRHGDLLEAASLGERFDLVEASGVLHHLADPLDGWRRLAALVRPGGFMRIALYSDKGRRHVVRARALVAEHGLAPTPEGIRRCRALIRERSGDELLARFLHSEDFYSMSGCRDLLFHVQEHRFDLMRVKAMVDELGLRFLGFEFPDSGRTASRYRVRFPGDLALTSLENWHRFEQDNPDAFGRMYQFWVCKP